MLGIRGNAFGYKGQWIQDWKNSMSVVEMFMIWMVWFRYMGLL